MSKAWSRDIELDLGTFGKSKACHALADMMNKNVIAVYEKHRVLSFISTAIHEYKAVATIKHSGVRTTIMYRSRDLFAKRISEMPYPANFLSFMANVNNYLANKYLKEADWTIAPYKGEESRSSATQPAR